jgi:hypothetical protein
MATKGHICFSLVLVPFALSLLPASHAQVPKTDRDEIDQVVGVKGTYVAEEGVYKIVFPKEAATLVLDYQTLPSTLGLNTWAAFSPARHHGALLTGQFLLLADEVDSVISSAVNANLEVTGLADTTIFDGPVLKTLDVSGVGSYQQLAFALRRVLDETQRIARERALRNVTQRRPSVSLDSSITPGPIDKILSMHASSRTASISPPSEGEELSTANPRDEKWDSAPGLASLELMSEHWCMARSLPPETNCKQHFAPFAQKISTCSPYEIT